MGKSKYIIVILLLLVGISAFFALSTLSQKEAVEKEKAAVQLELGKAKDTIDKLAADRKDLSQKLDLAERKSKSLQQQIDSLKNQSEKLAKERDQWKERVDALKGERDQLMAKLQERPEPQIIYKEAPAEAKKGEETTKEKASEFIPKDDLYWAEVLKEKASLQLDLEKAQSDINDYAVQLEESKKNVSDLELQISSLKEDKEELERKIKYSEDLVNTLSIDLAREKNDKRYVADRFDGIKEENTKLRGQVKELSSAKVTLEKSIANLTEEKTKMERRLAETESIIQNRVDEILDIKRSLDKKLKTASTPAVSKEVELPPIIVSAPSSKSPGTATAPGYNGRVVSVNEKSNFVIVNLGENDGIRAGDRLSVYRDNKYIAGLEVIQTRKDIAAADIKQKGAKVKVGDVVR